MTKNDDKKPSEEYGKETKFSGDTEYIPPKKKKDTNLEKKDKV